MYSEEGFSEFSGRTVGVYKVTTTSQYELGRDEDPVGSGSAAQKINGSVTFFTGSGSQPVTADI